MTYATASERQAFISGLRGLADFLEENPEIPTPVHTDVLVFPPHATNTEKRLEIDAIAARIGADTRITSVYKHYVTSRTFGAVEYRAVAIPSADTKEY